MFLCVPWNTWNNRFVSTWNFPNWLQRKKRAHVKITLGSLKRARETDNQLPVVDLIDDGSFGWFFFWKAVIRLEKHMRASWLVQNIHHNTGIGRHPFVHFIIFPRFVHNNGKVQKKWDTKGIIRNLTVHAKGQSGGQAGGITILELRNYLVVGAQKMDANKKWHKRDSHMVERSQKVATHLIQEKGTAEEGRLGKTCCCVFISFHSIYLWHEREDFN